MEVLANLIDGFAVALRPENLLFVLIGVVVGTLVGILPGLGPSAAIALLLPLTFRMDGTSALIMLLGIYYGAKYGGAITSILINSPGEASSVMTAVEGHVMAQNGRAGPALGLAAVSSFIGGTLSVIALMLFAPLLADFAINFGPPEYFALVVMGLSMVAVLGGRSVLRSLLAALLGLLLATVGLSPMSGAERFTFGFSSLIDGIDFVIVAMGLFAVAEILVTLESDQTTARITVSSRQLWPDIRDVIASKWSFVRATVIGFFVGVLPGAGASIASFLAYGVERRVSFNRAQFGRGAPQGLAAAETADNAAAGGTLVPLLTLGIPGSGVTAILLGAMVIYGLRPGPLLFVENPTFVWGLIASMYIGNVMLVVLNLPVVPVFASVLRLPYSLLYPLILVVLIIGAFALRGSIFDVYLLVAFGALGYLMRKLDYPPAPLVLGLVLGPLFERALSQSLIMSDGSLAVFFTRPISAFLLSITAAAFVWALWRLFSSRRRLGTSAVRQPFEDGE